MTLKEQVKELVEKNGSHKLTAALAEVFENNASDEALKTNPKHSKAFGAQAKLFRGLSVLLEQYSF